MGIMETIEYYPALKVAFGMFIGLCWLILVDKDFWHIPAVFAVYVIMTVALNPIHTDNTKANDQRSNQTNNKYACEYTNPKVKLHVDSFEEHMDRDYNRCERKN